MYVLVPTSGGDDDDDFDQYWIAIGVCIGLLVLIIILLIFLALRRRRKYYVTRLIIIFSIKIFGIFKSSLWYKPTMVPIPGDGTA